MVLNIKCFSTFNEILEYFNDIWIIFIYYIYTMIVIEKKKVLEGYTAVMGGTGGSPQSFYNISKI